MLLFSGAGRVSIGELPTGTMDWSSRNKYGSRVCFHRQYNQLTLSDIGSKIAKQAHYYWSISPNRIYSN